MNLISAFRPKTLVAGAVPVVVGHFLAMAQGFDGHLWISFFCLLSAGCIQIATNLFNDAIDFEKGADGENRLGPLRWSQSGKASSHRVFLWAFAFSFLALCFGIPIVIEGGWPFIILGLLSLFLAYSYTGGPFPLAYLGLGDIFVILFFGVFAVGGVFFLQTKMITSLAVVGGLQVGFLATILIAVNNLRDSKTDVDVGKKTLAVRFGDRFVQIEILILLMASYLFLFLYPLDNWKFLPLLTLPLGIKVGMDVFKLDDKSKLNGTLGKAGLLQLLFGILLAIGLGLQ